MYMYKDAAVFFFPGPPEFYHLLFFLWGGGKPFAPVEIILCLPENSSKIERRSRQRRYDRHLPSRFLSFWVLAISVTPRTTSQLPAFGMKKDDVVGSRSS